MGAPEPTGGVGGGGGVMTGCVGVTGLTVAGGGSAAGRVRGGVPGFFLPGSGFAIAGGGGSGGGSGMRTSGSGGRTGTGEGSGTVIEEDGELLGDLHKRALERFKKYCSHSADENNEAVFLIFGGVSAQSQVFTNLLFRRSLAKNQKPLLRIGYSFF